MYINMRMRDLKVKTISIQDAMYPAEFRSIPDAPEFIYVMGNLELLKAYKKVAIIGARKADAEGNDVAYRLGRQYAGKDYVVVSGLALGCDTSAHKGCLDAGGYTIAIVGNGLDIVHPKENRELVDRILESGGLVMSEQPFGVKATPKNLVARNRLQAALSEITVVAQCPAKSGTLYTVDFARKYGKKVKAVKYNTLNEYNEGNWNLLNSGKAQIERIDPSDAKPDETSCKLFGEGAKFGLKDSEGNVILPAVFDDIKYWFKDRLKELPVPVIKEGKYGLAAADGTDRLILPCDYDYIGLRKGYYLLQKGGERGFYTKVKLFFPLNFDRLYISSSRDVLEYHKNCRFGYISLVADWVTEPIFEDAVLGDLQLVKVWHNGRIGYIDKSGNFTEKEEDGWLRW